MRPADVTVKLDALRDSIKQDLLVQQSTWAERNSLTRAQLLISQGELSKAVNELTSFGVAPGTDETREALRAKFPETSGEEAHLLQETLEKIR